MHVPDVRAYYISRLLLRGEALNFYDSTVVNGNEEVLNFVGGVTASNPLRNEARCKYINTGGRAPWGPGHGPGRDSPGPMPIPSPACCVTQQDVPPSLHPHFPSSRVKGNAINYTGTVDVNLVTDKQKQKRGRDTVW